MPPPPREQGDGSAADPSGSGGDAPGVDQAWSRSPAEPVLAAPGAREEERLDLSAVEVALLVELMQDGQVTESRFGLGVAGSRAVDDVEFGDVGRMSI